MSSLPVERVLSEADIEAIASAVLAKLSTKQKSGPEPRCLCGECNNCKARERMRRTRTMVRMRVKRVARKQQQEVS